VTGWVWFKRRKLPGDLSHKVLGFLFCIAVIHFFSIVCELGHRDAYAVDGIGHPYLDDLSIALDAIVELCFVCLFIVVAKGLYISSSSIRGLRSVIQIMALYIVATLGLLFWAYGRFNPGLTFTIYQSGAGILLVSLRIATFLWLLTSVQTSWKREHNEKKRGFYVWFTLFAFLWFLSFPALVLTSVLLSTWNRRRFVWIMLEIVLLFTYSGWWVLFGCNNSYLTKDGSEHAELVQDETAADEGPTTPTI